MTSWVDGLEEVEVVGCGDQRWPLSEQRPPDLEHSPDHPGVLLDEDPGWSGVERRVRHRVLAVAEGRRPGERVREQVGLGRQVGAVFD